MQPHHRPQAPGRPRAGGFVVERGGDVATIAADRADVVEALAHATAAPVRDWPFIDALLDAYLDSVRGQ